MLQACKMEGFPLIPPVSIWGLFLIWIIGLSRKRQSKPGFLIWEYLCFGLYL